MPTSEWITVSTQVKGLGVLQKRQDELVQHPIKDGLTFCIGDDHVRSTRRARQIATVVVGEFYYFRAPVASSVLPVAMMSAVGPVMSLQERKRFATDEVANV